MKIITPDPIDHSDRLAEVDTYMGDRSLHHFAIGFIELADIATKRAIENRCSIDSVIPAILYSLRHSVELFLKSVIYDLKITIETEAIKGRHDLSKIFNDNKEDIKIALEYEPRTNSFHWRDWLKDFEEIIEAVSELDPDGQSIRYPADMKLKPNKGGRYIASTKNVDLCLARIRAIYQKYDERNC